jgi:hypothetical protein
VVFSCFRVFVFACFRVPAPFPLIRTAAPSDASPEVRC